MKFRCIFLLTFFVTSVTVKAQIEDTLEKAHIVFELPVFDLPYQFDAVKTVADGNVTAGSFFKGYANPSMHQSLSLSTDLYTGMHYSIDRIFHINNRTDYRSLSFIKRLSYVIVLYGTDMISIYAPGFDGWLHEEYHRSVMSRYHVNSFNDMNTFPLGAETVSVNSIADDDLIRFKRESPADFIRMHVAGIEGEYLLNDKLQYNNFFYNQNLRHELIYWLTTLNSIMYVQTCSDPEEVDPLTDEMNELENAIPDRDFTGLDFTAWTYDLFHPYQAYEDRGIHPSGVGIDRYIKTTDLTSGELSYLKKQGRLQWFNVVSPMMFGVRKIMIWNYDLYGNFSFRNFLTPFGNDLSFNVLLQNSRYNCIFSYHGYKNYHNYFPAVEAQLIDVKKNIGSYSIYVSPRILMGIQPRDQAFTTNKSSFIGLAECKAELQMKGIIHPYVELSAKTKGWVAGNEFLNDNISFRCGIISRLKRK